MTRRCPDCHADISHRSVSAMRCEPCAKAHIKRRNTEIHYQKYQPHPLKVEKGVRWYMGVRFIVEDK